jgi:hypothetical protein
VAIFVATCTRFIEVGHTLRRDLVDLLNDSGFRNLLEGEGLRTLPLLLHTRLYGCPQSCSACDTPPLRGQTPLHGSDAGGGLRHLGPARLRQIQQMRMAFDDFSPTFVKLLVAASRANEFVEVPKSSALRHTMQAKIVELFRPIEDRARELLPSFAEEAYCYALTRAYIRKLRTNDHILGYIRTTHPKIYRRLLSSSLALGRTDIGN